MFDVILVPLDGSPRSEQILERVAPLLELGAPELQLLRVLPPDGRGRQEAEEYLGPLAQSFTAAGHRARVRLETDDPAHAIVEAAEAARPCLVAMSTHGRGGLSRWIRGSVAERVLRSCSQPLLLAPPEEGARDEPRRFERILLPLDGSEEAAEIVPLVQALALAQGAEVLLLCVEWPELFGEHRFKGELPEGEQARRLLAPYQEQLQRAGVAAQLRTALGPPAEWILETAKQEQVDLLALTTHGRSGASRWFFGSVAEKVLRKSSCPVLVHRTLHP